MIEALVNVVSFHELLILTFAVSLNSLSILRLESKIDSEFKEAANRMLSDLLPSSGGTSPNGRGTAILSPMTAWGINRSALPTPT